MTIRAKFDGRAFVPLDPLDPNDLSAGQIVEIVLRREVAPPPGSPAALRKAMHETPSVPREWLDEMEQAIEAGKRPVRYEGIFDRE